MSDKSFEQQVKEELSDLRIIPNAAVWESVSASLQKERKRRWAIWLIVLLVGITSAGFWWSLQDVVVEKDQQKIVGQKKNEVIVQDQIVKESRSDQDQTPAVIHHNSTISKPKQLLDLSINKSVTPEERGTKSKIVIHKETEKKIDDISINNTSLANSSIKDNTQQEEKEKKVESESNNVTQSIDDTTKNIIRITNKLDTISIVKDKINLIDAVDEESKESIIIKPLADTVKSDIVSLNKKKSKWQWRVGVTSGISGVRNSLTSLFEGANKSAYSEAMRSSFLPNTPSVPIGSATQNRPVVRDAFSFGFSLELLRNVGKQARNNLGFTAAYNLYKTRTGIGTQNIGTVQFNNVSISNVGNTYYNVKDSSVYTSSYHFLHLGIHYYHTLKWIKGVDMKWFTGAGVNFLLGANGLHLGYDSTGMYLFRNSTLFRSLQVDISTGLAFSLDKKKKMQLIPHVQYMLSNLSKQQGVNQHLFRPGLRLSFALDKKK